MESLSQNTNENKDTNNSVSPDTTKYIYFEQEDFENLQKMFKEASIEMEAKRIKDEPFVRKLFKAFAR